MSTMPAEQIHASMMTATCRGEKVGILVDDADIPAIAAAGPWYVCRNGYVRATSTGQYLHHFILGFEPVRSARVSHCNLDRLDNRRANLIVGRPIAQPTLFTSEILRDGQPRKVGTYASSSEALNALEAAGAR